MTTLADPIATATDPTSDLRRAEEDARTYYAVRCPRCHYWELPTPFPSPGRFPNRRMDPPAGSCHSGRLVAGQPCGGMWVEHRLDGKAAHAAFMRDRDQEAREQREAARRAAARGGRP